MNILVLNGPNLNRLGLREPELYGDRNYAALEKFVRDLAGELGIELEIHQSNHEGVLVDKIQAAYGKVDAIVLNAAAYTHTSVALLDALKAVGIPTVEVHISDVDTREEFRRVSYVRAACVACIKGHGFAGYCEAIDLLLSLGQPVQGEKPPCV